MKTILQALLRHILTTLGGGLTTKGLIEADELTTGVAAAVTLFGVGWSVWDKVQRRKAGPAPTGNSSTGIGLQLLFIGLALPLLVGCGSLDSAGVYQSNKVLYTADRTIVESYDLLHTFVKWEYEHREALARWPEIRQAADHVRANARQWISTATALRDAYASAPSGEGRKALTQSLAVLRTAMTEATHYLEPVPEGAGGRISKGWRR